MNDLNGITRAVAAYESIPGYGLTEAQRIHLIRCLQAETGKAPEAQDMPSEHVWRAIPLPDGSKVQTIIHPNGEAEIRFVGHRSWDPVKVYEGGTEDTGEVFTNIALTRDQYVGLLALIWGTQQDGFPAGERVADWATVKKSELAILLSRVVHREVEKSKGCVPHDIGIKLFAALATFIAKGDTAAEPAVGFYDTEGHVEPMTAKKIAAIEQLAASMDAGTDEYDRAENLGELVHLLYEVTFSWHDLRERLDDIAIKAAPCGGRLGS